MGKLICITGKSAVGKDTLFKLIKNTPFLGIKPVIPYTTRPIRANEKDGGAYRFVSVEEMDKLEKEGFLLEKRTYHTTKGDWHYFTPKLNLDEPADRIMITTPEAFGSISRHYAKEKLILILLEADEKKRFMRSFKREAEQPEPNYKEICRRFIADEKDFKDVDFSDMHCQYVINADNSVLHCYFDFLAVLRGIRKNKPPKLKTKPQYPDQTDIFEKCRIFLNKTETGENIKETGIIKLFGLYDKPN